MIVGSNSLSETRKKISLSILKSLYLKTLEILHKFLNCFIDNFKCSICAQQRTGTGYLQQLSSDIHILLTPPV